MGGSPPLNFLRFMAVLLAKRGATRPYPPLTTMGGSGVALLFFMFVLLSGLKRVSRR